MKQIEKQSNLFIYFGLPCIDCQLIKMKAQMIVFADSDLNTVNHLEALFITCPTFTDNLVFNASDSPFQAKFTYMYSPTSLHFSPM